MIKFKALLMLKTITGLMVFVKYALWCYFFMLQGRAIELAIAKNTLAKELIYTLVGFIFVKMMVMLCDVFQKFLAEYYKNSALKHQWNCHIPEAIYSDNQHQKNDMNVLFFDYLPRLFECKIALCSNRVTMLAVFVLTIVAFVHTDFFWGFFALLLVFALNYLSKNVFVKKIDAYQKECYQNKITTLDWIEQYFASFREVSKNWLGLRATSWQNDAYNHYFISKKNQTIFYLYRDLLAQVLVELPFLLNTAVVIVGVYYEYLTLMQLFVWVGFSQFMISASNAYLENKILKKQIDTLSSQSASIIENFSTNRPKTLIENNTEHVLFLEVVMQDGQVNTLSLEPGLYHIKGGNGSGKSTLINIILGFERKDYDFKCAKLAYFINNINPNTVRVIDREAVIFKCFPNFINQIYGPDTGHSVWLAPVSGILNRLLSLELAAHWIEIFCDLERKFTIRANKTLSSGERVILSFMRFFSSWNMNVNLLIIDECDSFLDFKIKILFMNTLRELSRRMAIYISCHDQLQLSYGRYFESPKTAPLH